MNVEKSRTRSEFAYCSSAENIVVSFAESFKFHVRTKCELLRAMMSRDYGATSAREMVRVPSTEGIVSISLNDSWTGKKFLEAISPNSFHSARVTPDELSHVRIQTRIC